MKKEKDSAAKENDAGQPAPKAKLPKVKLTKKLRKKLDELRGKDPNIYPLW